MMIIYIKIESASVQTCSLDIQQNHMCNVYY